MIIASYQPYQLQFKSPVLTSRGSMSSKEGYYLTLERDNKIGVGECSYIKGLSIDDLEGYEAMLGNVCKLINKIADEFYTGKTLPPRLLERFPSLAFGLETALLDLQNGGAMECIKDSKFYAGEQPIPINGLVWMGEESYMQQQIERLLASGFDCIKIKVAAIDFREECRLLEGIRKRFTPAQIEIRLDANGGFAEIDVREKLRILAQFSIHSIEQPIKPQQYLLMRELCRERTIDIALDEELIGTHEPQIKYKLLETIMPQYIILKPSLLGGLGACDEWIELAERLKIGWWSTSALEGNLGLNAIAQWAAAKNPKMVQGLGTGSLYTNNIDSPLYIDSGNLYYEKGGKWGAL